MAKIIANNKKSFIGFSLVGAARRGRPYKLRYLHGAIGVSMYFSVPLFVYPAADPAPPPVIDPGLPGPSGSEIVYVPVP
jgi:hypothetical protein